jgi:hypothetical protein
MGTVVISLGDFIREFTKRNFPQQHHLTTSILLENLRLVGQDIHAFKMTNVIKSMRRTPVALLFLLFMPQFICATVSGWKLSHVCLTVTVAVQTLPPTIPGGATVLDGTLTAAPTMKKIFLIWKWFFDGSQEPVLDHRSYCVETPCKKLDSYIFATGWHELYLEVHLMETVIASFNSSYLMPGNNTHYFSS